MIVTLGSGIRAVIFRPGMPLKDWLTKQTVKPLALINASLYHSNGQPIGTIIEDLSLVNNEGNGYGFGVDRDGAWGFGSPWDRVWQDYFTGYTGIVQGGAYVPPSFPDAYVFDKALNRIGIGLRNDALTIATYDYVTIAQLGKKAVADGFSCFVNLDGGGSRFLYANGVTYYSSSRTPYNAIAFYAAEQKEDETEGAGDSVFKIALGAGHGLTTAGKRCMKALDPNETREWQLNDRICDKVEALLKNYEGYELLRLDDSDDGKDDIALASRVAAANKFGADVYISVHHNAGINGGTGGGICAYSYPGSKEGAAWRDAMYAALIAKTGLKGNRATPKLTGTFYVLKNTDAPATLLELGFMDSKTDVPIILSEKFADQCAGAIVEVLAARGGLKKKAVQSKTIYRVQVGAFSDKVNADRLMEQFKAAGYPAYITKS